MIQTVCSTCGGKQLLPDPPPKTKEENIRFRKNWDAIFDATQHPTERTRA